MDPRCITPRYFVSPQIAAEDLQALAEAGFKAVICNRPDAEVPPSHQANAIRVAAEAAGLRFEELPLTHLTMTAENVAKQRELSEVCEGPVLAYCASGTRCSVVWALGHAGEMSPDSILSKTAAAGYQLDNLRPALEQMTSKG